MNAKDLVSTAPNISSAQSYSTVQSPSKFKQPRNSSSIHNEKSLDIFIPANLKDAPNTSSPKRPRRNTTVDTSSPIKQPNSNTISPRSSINYCHTQSNIKMEQGSKSSVNLIYSRHSPKNVRKFTNDSINTNEIANFNRDLADSLDIERLKDLYDKEEIPFIDLNYLVDNDSICRINSNEKVPNRDPSENILLKHDLPQVSMDQREQMKFFVQIIYDAITHTREINKYYTSPLDFSYLSKDLNKTNEDDEEVDLSNINFPQMKCEMDIWLSTLNECVKVVGSRLKPISLIILVIQRELKKNFKQLISAIEIQNELITQKQRQQNNADRTYRSNSNKPNVLPSDQSPSKTQESINLNNTLNDSKSTISNSNSEESSPMIGVLKRDVQHLEERITQLKCELIASQSELKQKEKRCQKLLDVNHHLRETITDAERKIAAFSVKSTEVGASGLGHVPDAAQVVWGELSSFARDMTKALKKVNMDLLLPENTAQMGQPKLALTSPSSPTANFNARRARRKSYSSSVQNNLLFDFDIYSLANSGAQQNKEAPAGQPQRPTMMVASPSAVKAGVSFPPASGGQSDAFPKANPTMAPPPASADGDAFPRAKPTMAPPPANGGGDAFPKAKPTMAPPPASADGDAFPSAKPGIAFLPASTGGDAFPKASTGGDAFPKANTEATDAFPKASTGGDAFPRANPGIAFPPPNSGGDAFPRANATMAPPPANSSGDAFPRANPGISFPPASTGDSFPKASTGDSFTPSFPKVGFAAAPLGGPKLMPAPSKGASGDSFQKRVRAPIRPDKKLHFTNFFPVMCSFTDTCSGNLLSKPPSTIYTQLESELRAFLVQVFQKYKERMAGVRGEIEKMNDKFNTQLAHVKHDLSSRSLWAKALFLSDDLLTLPKDVKVSDDYQASTFSEIAHSIIVRMNPQESEAFTRLMSNEPPNSDSNQDQPPAGDKTDNMKKMRPTTASDALFDTFPPNMTQSMIDFIAYVNKNSKADISIDMFRRFFAGDLPFTHFIFFLKLYLYSQPLMSSEANVEQLRIDALSLLFNKYGYSTTFPEKVRSSLEEQYCSSFPSFIVLAMSLYSHIIVKLSKHIDNEMTAKPTNSPSSSKSGGSVSFGAKFARSSLGKQQFLLNYLKDNIINYIEPVVVEKKEEEEEERNEDYDSDDDDRRKKKKKKENKVEKPPMTPEKEAENQNAVEYIRAIAGSAKDLSSTEVAVEMFNYVIPLDNCLEDFDPQTQDLMVYLAGFNDKQKKSKKNKDKNKKILESIKPGDLLVK